ncbi:hypothetical protein BDZ91DRAFT_798040 [Kalaharituber pfeilii]|nr:hypothetical protein BDZ91DRAFT_798040 [Kalaharituber pfeilii]
MAMTATSMSPLPTLVSHAFLILRVAPSCAGSPPATALILRMACLESVNISSSPSTLSIVSLIATNSASFTVPVQSNSSFASAEWQRLDKFDRRGSQVARFDGSGIDKNNKNIWTVLLVKAHRGIAGNEAADEAVRVGTALQRAPEVVTEAGMRQRGRRERAGERNRLELAYRPLERLGHLTGRLAGLLGGKGLRAWRWQIGEGDGPECRWCGEEEETTRHLLGQCRVWRRRWPGGEDHVRRPPRVEGEGGEDPLMRLMEMLGE